MNETLNETLRFVQSASSTKHSRSSHHGFPGVLEEQAPQGLDCLRRIYEESLTDSNFTDRIADFPQFEWSELVIGKVLGKGGFGIVSEVQKIHCNILQDQQLLARYNSGLDGTDHSRMSFYNQDDDASMRSFTEAAERNGMVRRESRKFIARHCVRKGIEPRFAVKQLKKETLENPSKREQGLIDMAIETRMLSGIIHPNIVKMRAIAHCGMFCDEYFILMDRLYDTLEQRIGDWAARNKRIKGIAGRLVDSRGKKSAALYEERMHAAYDLAAAIEYLHDKQIVYRDIKPENAAFDIRGDIKIFDLGLAKELKDSLEEDDGTYNLTMMTGTPRYMAQEVANGDSYNASCDVYSFCLMFWQMLALKLPYASYGMRDLFEKVYNGPCERPTIKAQWHTSIKILLKRGWSHQPKERNTMAQISTILRNELIMIRNGDTTGLTHHKRRSTFIFRGVAESLRSLGRHNASQHGQLGTIESIRIMNDEDDEFGSERISSSRGTESQRDSARSLQAGEKSLGTVSTHRSMDHSSETRLTVDSGNRSVTFQDQVELVGGMDLGQEIANAEARPAMAVTAAG